MKTNTHGHINLNVLAEQIANEIHQTLYNAEEPEALDGDETDYIASRIQHHLDLLNGNTTGHGKNCTCPDCSSIS